MWDITAFRPLRGPRCARGVAAERDRSEGGHSPPRSADIDTSCTSCTSCMSCQLSDVTMSHHRPISPIQPTLPFSLFPNCFLGTSSLSTAPWVFCGVLTLDVPGDVGQRSAQKVLIKGAKHNIIRAPGIPSGQEKSSQGRQGLPRSVGGGTQSAVYSANLVSAHGGMASQVCRDHHGRLCRSTSAQRAPRNCLNAVYVGKASSRSPSPPARGASSSFPQVKEVECCRSCSFFGSRWCTAGAAGAGGARRRPDGGDGVESVQNSCVGHCAPGHMRRRGVREVCARGILP
ncbi:hypothetical protein DFH08DRAFT_385665 [Mycena albidolilacea]|uniref:Uncharacterized protein n=1 Tax=Mycena albidolilacea TaxID=1033008 RepID=A0AAD6ZGU5_9AGAR|nr:hypothetical protein DFH08DRAFT_385665 [Mycena albidolilacea]